MSSNSLGNLTTFIQRLEEGRIHYSLSSPRDDAVMVLVTVPGERWEIEFFVDGTVEVEKFDSVGEIATEEALDELIVKHAEPERVKVN